jgi:hypothetical protein
MTLAAAVLLAVSLSAQERVEVGPAASAGVSAGPAGAAALGASGPASLSPVPGFVAAPALAPGLSAAAAASPLAAAAPSGAAAAALPASAIAPLDPASLPDKGRDFTGDEWAKLTAAAPDDGARAVLRSMRGGSTPQLSVQLADGESVTGSFLGLAGDKLVFSSGGKLLGLSMSAGGITEVIRRADAYFDGTGDLRPVDVVVHSRPAAVRAPFRDLSAYKGRYLEIDARDLDDLRWSAHTVPGRLVKADGEEVVLEGAKGRATLSAEFHRIDAVRERTPHYDSRGQVNSLSEVNAHVPPGTPVELTILKKTVPATGLFRGVRSDPQGDYVLLEVANSDGSTTIRAYRDVVSVRTQGYRSGELMPGAAPVYAAPAE